MDRLCVDINELERRRDAVRQELWTKTFNRRCLSVEIRRSSSGLRGKGGRRRKGMDTLLSNPRLTDISVLLRNRIVRLRTEISECALRCHGN